MKYPHILIVDEHDNPIGAENMFVAHEKGLVHRIVRVMVEDNRGRLLLQKRSARMDRYPNCWDNSAAGHVDEGEDYDIAAKRELSEEIGIVRTELEELGTYYTDQSLGDIKRLRRFNRVYKTTAAADEATIDNDEVAEVRWFTLEEARNLLEEKPDEVTDGLRDVLARYYV
jgi:isopentenyl-diphosphate delta-isomerase type 1